MKTMFMLICTVLLSLFWVPVAIVYIPVSIIYIFIKFVYDTLGDAIVMLKIGSYSLETSDTIRKEDEE